MNEETKATAFLMFTSENDDDRARWFRFDEAGKPTALTLDVKGMGRFLIPIVPDEDAS